MRAARQGGAGDRLELPPARGWRPADRAVSTGASLESGGPAASGEVRRSTLVKLADDLRFLAADHRCHIPSGVASPDAHCEVLSHVRRGLRHPQGPGLVLNGSLSWRRKSGSEITGRLVGAGGGPARPVSFRDGMPVAPPIMPGWDRFPVRDRLASQWGCPVTVDNDVNVDGPGRAARGGGPFPRRADLRESRHRHRLRNRPRRPCSTEESQHRRRHRAHQTRRLRPSLRVWPRSAAWRPTSAARLSPATHFTLARSGRSNYLADLLAQKGELSAKTSPPLPQPVTSPRPTWSVRAAVASGHVVASLVSFLNPGWS